MLCDMLGVVKLCFVCRAVGCIFGELLNNSPLFPVSMLQIFVDRSDTRSKERESWKYGGFSLVPRPFHHPVFDHLQYTKMEVQGLGAFIT